MRKNLLPLALTALLLATMACRAEWLDILTPSPGLVRGAPYMSLWGQQVLTNQNNASFLTQVFSDPNSAYTLYQAITNWSLNNPLPTGAFGAESNSFYVGSSGVNLAGTLTVYAGVTVANCTNSGMNGYYAYTSPGVMTSTNISVNTIQFNGATWTLKQVGVQMGISTSGNILGGWQSTVTVTANGGNIVANIPQWQDYTNLNTLASNALSVATNAYAISTNAYAISTNLNTVVTNALATATNAVAISTNAAAISTNAYSISTNALAIASLASTNLFRGTNTAPLGTTFTAPVANVYFTNGSQRALAWVNYTATNVFNLMFTNVTSGEGWIIGRIVGNATNSDVFNFLLSPSDVVLLTNLSNCSVIKSGLRKE